MSYLPPSLSSLHFHQRCSGSQHASQLHTRQRSLLTLHMSTHKRQREASTHTQTHNNTNNTYRRVILKVLQPWWWNVELGAAWWCSGSDTDSQLVLLPRLAWQSVHVRLQLLMDPLLDDSCKHIVTPSHNRQPNDSAVGVWWPQQHSPRWGMSVTGMMPDSPNRSAPEARSHCRRSNSSLVATMIRLRLFWHFCWGATRHEAWTV